MIIFQITLFFFDFFMYVLLEKWVVCAMLAYFICMQVRKTSLSFSLECFYLPVFLILIQDFFVNGVWGLSFLYLVPIVLLVPKIKNVFKVHNALLITVLLFFALIIQDFIIKRWIIGQNIGIYSTITKIFINILVGYLVLLGVRSSRSFT